MNLTNNHQTSRYPQTTTMAELEVVARKRLGDRFLSVKSHVYSGQTQIEVRSWKLEYPTGRKVFVREACYSIA